ATAASPRSGRSTTATSSRPCTTTSASTRTPTSATSSTGPCRSCPRTPGRCGSCAPEADTLRRLAMTSPLGRAAWCGPLGLVLLPGGAARADEAEDRAAAFVKKLGGIAVRDDQVAGKPVVKVTLRFNAVTDEALKELAPLRSLKDLHLG